MSGIETTDTIRKMLNRNGPIPPQDMPRPVPSLAQGDFAPPSERDRLHKLADELDRPALKEIAYRLAHLTFGEMVELSEGIGADAAKIWAWATADAA